MATVPDEAKLYHVKNNQYIHLPASLNDTHPVKSGLAILSPGKGNKPGDLSVFNLDASKGPKNVRIIKNNWALESIPNNSSQFRMTVLDEKINNQYFSWEEEDDILKNNVTGEVLQARY